jgi:hypothetical protein
LIRYSKRFETIDEEFRYFFNTKIGAKLSEIWVCSKIEKQDPEKLILDPRCGVLALVKVFTKTTNFPGL